MIQTVQMVKQNSPCCGQCCSPPRRPTGEFQNPHGEFSGERINSMVNFDGEFWWWIFDGEFCWWALMVNFWWWILVVVVLEWAMYKRQLFETFCCRWVPRAVFLRLSIWVYWVLDRISILQICANGTPFDLNKSCNPCFAGTKASGLDWFKFVPVDG